MITAYHRPHSLDEAMKLLSRPTPTTVPLGGGTVLTHDRGGSLEVVDLQALGLNRISQRGKSLDVGASVTLQQLLESEQCPAAMAAALRLEATVNLRNASSVAGAVMVCDGRSAFLTVLLALDARLEVRNPRARSLALGDLLPTRLEVRPGFLITGIELPLGAKLAYDYVARTPADSPIASVALAQWPSGRTRMAVGGFGPMPLLAMDGNEAGGVEMAARNAFHEANDPWGSAEYRMDVAATLARRCLERLTTHV